MLLALAMVLAFAGCAKTEAPATEAPAPVTTAAPVETAAAETEAAVPETEAAAAVMSHADYVAAAMDSEVTILSVNKTREPDGRFAPVFYGHELCPFLFYRRYFP